ncbi:MAG: 50S ribosomal protein L17 [Dehalococcoidia bacterium]|nr:50S ribosomal protein L17 [Dehalococcoidia bacterium]MYA52766.1 50S ribosomal protein L17 [Dehalococcoidia bacterium]
MRHRKAGRHLGRDSAHRKALYRNLVTDLLRYERITTTDAKAREIRPIAEKMITLGRRGDLHARRQALRYIYDRYVVEKLFDDIAPRMADRPGGYLRITRLEPRKGDGASMAVIETVDYQEALDLAEEPPADEAEAAPALDAADETEAVDDSDEPEASIEAEDDVEEPVASVETDEDEAEEAEAESEDAADEEAEDEER